MGPIAVSHPPGIRAVAIAIRMRPRFSEGKGSQASKAAALEAARPGDVVLVAGKGHETTQTIGSTVIEFDDRAVVRALLGGPA